MTCLREAVVHQPSLLTLVVFTMVAKDRPQRYQKLIASLCAIFQLPYGAAGYQRLSVFKPFRQHHVRFMMDSSKDTADASVQSPLKLIEGTRHLIDDHDTFLLDMWGVMHDGSRPYDGVLDVIRKLRDAGKKLIILSNSGKRRDNSVRMLQKLGFDPEDFDQIITSGEVAYQMLSGQEASLGCQSWSVLSELRANGPEKMKVFVFGSGDSDETYCESCGWTLAPIEEASLIVARGTFTINDGSTVINKREDEDLYHQAMDQKLKEAAKRRLPMIVTNPDKIRPDAERPPMPGKIGDDYWRVLGGDDTAEALIKRIGKPFRDVYDIALKDTTDLSRACMIGDALETDVAGGSMLGITTVWVVKDGIHYPDIEGKPLSEGASSVLEEFNKRDATYAKGRQLEPSVLMPHFRW